MDQERGGSWLVHELKHAETSLIPVVNEQGYEETRRHVSLLVVSAPRDRAEDRGDPILSQCCRRCGMLFVQRITCCTAVDDSSAQFVRLTLTSPVCCCSLQCILSRIASLCGRGD